MSLEHRNEYEEFEERFGEYVFYGTERDEVLEEFRSAYLEGEAVEKLLMVEEPGRLENDIFRHFVEEGSPDGILSRARSFLGSSIGEEEYSEFMQDFEVEPADEDMLYWCRYEP